MGWENSWRGVEKRWKISLIHRISCKVIFRLKWESNWEIEGGISLVHVYRISCKVYLDWSEKVIGNFSDTCT